VVVHPEAVRELKAIPVFHRRTIVSVVRKVLAEHPTLERRSRVKRMRAEFYPPYRLRVGDFRVYYDVDERRLEVLVLHVWEKGRQSTPNAVGPTRGRKP
jgi:mRNA-degrading endonuclease RelE of RelBE toxin-antitoxin system